jgi:hypothetical protein
MSIQSNHRCNAPRLGSVFGATRHNLADVKELFPTILEMASVATPANKVIGQTSRRIFV